MTHSSRTDNIELSRAINWQADDRVTAFTADGSFEMYVVENGEQPIIDILEIPEGRTDGPLVSFLGSVATHDALLENHIFKGSIVRNFQLVFKSRQGQTLMMPGRIERVSVYDGRARKPK